MTTELLILSGIFVTGCAVLLPKYLARLFYTRWERALHPLAFERDFLATYLENATFAERIEMLSVVEERNPELYESWINEPYPAPGDYVWLMYLRPLP